MSKMQADIGIFGGSGLYQFLTNAQAITVKTPYGLPSAPLMVGEYAGKKIAFLPRHGERHQYPPHLIPYLANVYAFKLLGVKRIIAPTASGSLSATIAPGDFVICDQVVDRTHSREDTYFTGDTMRSAFSNATVAHISLAEPYCKILRKIAVTACKKNKITHHKTGTVVVINGPRFSTTAESRWYQESGWQVINMTQYPEVTLARELEMCYVNISLITDYDAGLKDNPQVKPVSVSDVLKIFKDNNDRVKQVILAMIEAIDFKDTCSCQASLKEAVL